MKLWSGRFGKETDALVNDFNASIHFDQRLYKEDITGSLAHAKMLGDCGIIPKEDAAAIQDGLLGILEDIEAGKVEFTADNEDIHMNVEACLPPASEMPESAFTLPVPETIRWHSIFVCMCVIKFPH